MTRRTKLAAGSAAALLVGGGTAAAIVIGDRNTPATASAKPAAASTATVERATLTETTDVGGTLDYGDTTAVSGRGSAVVTWLPAGGAVIHRGQQVYRADDDPVVLLYGSIPLYRVLKPGDRGADVRMLETNLAALGYSGFAVNDEYTRATATAVKQWQDDLGITKTGTIDPARFVVARTAIRIAAVTATLGAPAQGNLLTYTATTRRIDVDLDTEDEALVRKGMHATVTLPDGRTVAATVTVVGTVATSSGGDQGQDPTTTIPVTLAVSDQKRLGTLDQAPVTVTVVSEQHRDVLAVPVTALVALLDGGYGVEIVAADGTKHYAAVRTGMFADGKVEVSGPEIKAGVRVTVPA